VKLVIVESPYAGDVEKHLAYVRAAMNHCLRLRETPFASHALYTQAGVLDDNIPEQRKLGIEAGFAWGEVADAVLFYVDLGWSSGMRAGLERAKQRRMITTKPVEIRIRTLGDPWSNAPLSDLEWREGV